MHSNCGRIPVCMSRGRLWISQRRALLVVDATWWRTRWCGQPGALFWFFSGPLLENVPIQTLHYMNLSQHIEHTYGLSLFPEAWGFYMLALQPGQRVANCGKCWKKLQKLQQEYWVWLRRSYVSITQVRSASYTGLNAVIASYDYDLILIRCANWNMTIIGLMLEMSPAIFAVNMTWFKTTFYANHIMC